MITGFNTDVEYNGEVYHVQTEDKGLEARIILSLVYQGGTILASKRSPYDDLLKDGKIDEKALAERLSKQHKLICAAIKAGRIEDLKRMSMQQSGSFSKKLIVKKELFETTSKEDSSEELILPVGEIVRQELSNQEEIIEIPVDIAEEPIVEEVEIIEEEMLPEEAVEILRDLTEEKTSVSSLNVEILGSKVFKAGDRRILSIVVTQSETKKAVSNLPVIVKVLGSAFRPVIYHARTDENGLALIKDFQIPIFKSGRAAILIKVLYNGEEVEIRQLVRPS